MLLSVVGVYYIGNPLRQRTKLNFIILSNDPVSHQPENGYCCGCREREENVFVIYVLCLKKDDFAQCSLGRVISQCISYH